MRVLPYSEEMHRDTGRMGWRRETAMGQIKGERKSRDRGRGRSGKKKSKETKRKKGSDKVKAENWWRKRKTW